MLIHNHNRTDLRVFRRGQLIPRGQPPIAPVPPAPPAPMPWDAFRTHAELNEWVEHFQDDHALALPVGWEGMTLADKREWLNANVSL